MWSKRRLTPYVTPVLNCKLFSKEMLCSEFREESPVDQFRFQEIEIDGEKSVRLTSDIYMLFNQDKLDRLSKQSLLDYFDQLSISQPQFSELRSKLTDDQLMSFVKSRFIQSKSELMAWSQYLMNCSDTQIAQFAQSQQTVQESSIESSAAVE